MNNLSLMQQDFLKEMGSIGVGHAVTGLSQLLGKRIEITNPKVHCLALDEVVNYLGGAEQMVCALLLKLTGDIEGSIMLVFPNNTSTRLLNLWLEDKGPAQAPLTPFHESALKELSNIATGAYLTALSKLTGNTFRCTPPLIANDILGSLLEEILSETALEEDNIFLIDTEFLLEQQTLDGFILFIVAPHSMKQIFTKLDLG